MCCGRLNCGNTVRRGVVCHRELINLNLLLSLILHNLHQLYNKNYQFDGQHFDVKTQRIIFCWLSNP